MLGIDLINVGKQILFLPLTFLPYILNCYIINFRWYEIIRLISVLMEGKIDLLELAVMEFVG